MQFQKIDLQDTKEFWNRDYVVFNDTAKLPENYDISKDGFVDVIHQWCAKHNVPQDARILECGCGGGRILMLWNECSKKYGWQFVLEGVDHSPKAIEIAKERLPMTRFSIIGIEELLVKDKYDVIFTHTALQHNSSWKQDLILPQIHKAIKDSGLFWMINEKTFSTWEDGKLKSPFYCDDRGSTGTAAWWIRKIAPFRFELLDYDKSSYTWRKI